MPYAESFEAFYFTDGRSIGGIDSWYGDVGAALISLDSDVLDKLTDEYSSGYPIATTHTKVLELVDGITNRVESPGGLTVYTDFLLMPEQWDITPPADTEAQMKAIVNDSDELVIWHAYTNAGFAGFSNEWHALTGLGTPVVTGAWVRVQIVQDYQHNMFQMRIDGSDPITDAKGWSRHGGTQPGPWFYMVQRNGYMSSFRASGPGYLDDLTFAFGPTVLMFR